MGFSGGTYEEVGRWLWNFLTSHAKRADPRIEVELEHGDEREGRSYAARLTFGGRSTPLMEFDYKDVADNRGSLAWGRALAERTQQLAREHLLSGAPLTPRSSPPTR
jgi:hypothetical protein